MPHPNIGLYGLVFSTEEYTRHGEGCRGYVGVPTRRHGLVMAGRARCLKCGRWVGRKAWREMSRNLQEGVLDWDTLYDKGDNYRVFVRIAPDKRRPGPPSRLRPSNPCAEQPVLRNREVLNGWEVEVAVPSPKIGKNLTRKLKKMRNGASEETNRAVNSILGALQDAVDEYREDFDDEVLDCEEV